MEVKSTNSSIVFLFVFRIKEMFLLKNKRIPFLFLFFIVFCKIAITKESDPMWIADSLKNELSHTTEPEKRYVLWSNLADITAKFDRDSIYYSVYRNLYNDAKKHGDNNTQIIALLELSNCKNIDSLELYLKFSHELPVNTRTKGLQAMLRGQMEVLLQFSYTEKERVERIDQLLMKYKNIGEQEIDPYEKFFFLEAICHNLGNDVKGTHYLQYLEEMLELAEQMPPENYYLRGRAINRLILTYNAMENHVKAIETEKKNQAYIAELEKEYARQGRIYRSYDGYYYTSNRRILSNYPALTREEVEYYYNEIKKLSEKDSFLKNYFAIDVRTQIYYYMATKQYEQALFYIEKELEVEKKGIKNSGLLGFYIEALEALDKKDLLLDALEKHIEVLQEKIQNQSAEKQKELQILYDVESLNSRNTRLELEKSELQIRATKRYFIFGFCILSLLLLLVLILSIANIRNKKLTQSLKKEKQTLSSDRMKSIFIQNMSHEIRTPLNAIVGFSNVIATIESNNENEEIKLFSNTIMRNSELLLKLVDDLLILSNIDAGKFSINNKQSAVNKLCKMVLEQAKPWLESDTISFSYITTLSDDYTINTDAVKLEIALKNLVSNAVKFTTEGVISLSSELDKEKQIVRFSVVNQGVEIPSNQSEVIFERFVKLNEFTQGNGLGLYISRMIVEMLRGVIYLDTNDQKATRFVVEIPVDLKN